MSRLAVNLLSVVAVFFSAYILVNSARFEFVGSGVLAFLILCIASAALFQNLHPYFAESVAGRLAFLVGRLFFVGLAIFVVYQVSEKMRKDRISEDGVASYGIAGKISSRYERGKYRFYRHFTYRVKGRTYSKTVSFNDSLQAGDTIYIKYSARFPKDIEFIDNESNRSNGIVR